MLMPGLYLRPTFNDINPRIIWGLCIVCGVLFFLSSRRQP
jgi:hypothetical protein